MAEVSLSHWATVIVWFGLMCGAAFYFAHVCFQGLLRLARREKRDLLRKWGVEEDLLGTLSGSEYIGKVVGAAIGASITFALALLSSLLITDSPSIGADQIYNAITVFTIGLVLGFSVDSQRFEDIKRKVNSLEGLRDIFHERFSVSELLSVYESLQHSPKIFWEEYTQLLDEEVREETNRKYRERAIPFRDSLSIKYNRITIAVAALTFLVAVLLAGREFLS